MTKPENEFIECRKSREETEKKMVSKTPNNYSFSMYCYTKI
jgi:hypothetical protein